MLADLQLPLDRGLPQPAYRQLYERFKAAIGKGILRPGERVPSIRNLAGELQLSRGTVELAYQLLIGEGYLQARGAAGTQVSMQLSEARTAAVSRPFAPPRALSSIPLAGAPLPYQLGLPALDAFPRALWSRLHNRQVRRMSPAAMGYPAPAGLAPLRQALAAYLNISRGLACEAAQVFVCAGYNGCLELICRALLQPGDGVWHEDPGYVRSRRLLQAAGAQLLPMPVDEQGLDVRHAVERAAQARFALVTPAHQSPLGVALSLPRRLELLEWAGRQGSWIIEDDYDSEYRYSGRPLPALKSLDRQDRVLYCGTFSKVLFPGVRLGYLVVPQTQVEHFEQVAASFLGGCPEQIQGVVCDFIEQGHFARHLNRMRGLYGERRQLARQALSAELGGALDFADLPGGMHLLARLAQDDQALVQRAREAGLGLQALSNWCLQARPGNGLLLGFTNVLDPSMASQWAQRLARVMA
ncbi:PLP-dependent aminotransferase family protein [Pseudomonas sp. NPDC089530]|uniref:MocR-like pyridoxine biosynthesis transcription factor PdxR n=1 Tax=Pseudomonas sp. NPDC089530 TaxID=3390651 RepID=UPI003CFDDA63